MDTLHVYTDGSRIKNKNGDFVIGWGACTKFGVLTKGNREYGSNVNAEMLAISTAVFDLSHYNYAFLNNIDEVIISSDSNTSLQIIGICTRAKALGDAIDDDSENYKLAREILRDVERLESKGIKVKYEKVLGHSDELGNSFADYIATSEAEKNR